MLYDKLGINDLAVYILIIQIKLFLFNVIGKFLLRSLFHWSIEYVDTM
jgi:hypothetical protein